MAKRYLRTITYLLTYLGPLNEEQRPSKTSRHLRHPIPAGFLLYHLRLSDSPPAAARPASLPLPCRFHLRAWRVVLFGGFLKVWPIQDHFLLRIYCETSSCPALSHNTSFISLSDHLIPNILLRHVLRNVCSRLCTFLVVFHVSQP